MSGIGLHRSADLILGISQKLFCITASPANGWRAIASARAHTPVFM